MRCASVCVLSCFLLLAALSASAASEEETGYWTVSGPIPASDCLIVTPDPPQTNCDNFPTPDGAADIFANLPWDQAGYKACVVKRCGCTKAANVEAPEYQPNGMYCQPGKTFEESGYVFCNAMVDCFEDFWTCVAQEAWGRYLRQGLDALETGEKAYINDILTHGHTFGQPFHETNSFKSCAAIQCQAAASRKNCGLITCVPNNTQCNEYIQPPPAPMEKNLCSRACRAALLMMAMTIAAVMFSVTCCCCCPPRVRALKPLITDADQLSRSSAIISSSDNDEVEQAPLNENAPNQ